MQTWRDGRRNVKDRCVIGSLAWIVRERIVSTKVKRE